MEEYNHYDKGLLLRDRYLKVADISQGSYGLVSVAKDCKKDNRLVAVKFIYPVDYKKEANKRSSTSTPAKLSATESVFTALLNEAHKEIKMHQILGDHPHISKLWDHFDTFLILEFYPRGDLYEAIHSNSGPATTQDIKLVFEQLLDGLTYCHNRGIYHRDLKPENILIDQDWSIKISDWGLSTTSKIVTNPNEFDIGSERYMAPELFDNNLEEYDASKVDIWSIGVILLTLVFHKNPFQVANYSDKRFIQFVNNREALFDIFSTMSGDLFSVLRFSLTIDPDNRDLASISEELKLLRYFTIDEEYWDNEDYEEEEEDGEYEDDEDDRDEDDERELDLEDYGSFGASISASPEKVSTPSVKIDGPTPAIYVSSNPDAPSTGKAAAPVATTASATATGTATPANESNTINANTTTVTTTITTPEEIPHNHRADALLSTNTELKPIPITGFKFHRNTRKPLNVASYNQNSQNTNRLYSGNNKFNREDFFTPRSVFNHYMDKYGEQRFTKLYENQNKKQSPPQRFRKRTWKKNYRKPQKLQQPSQQQQFHYHNQANDSHNHMNGRRKSRLYSTSKLRKHIVNGNVHTSLPSTYHHLPHPAANGTANGNTNTNGNAFGGANPGSALPNSQGKYIPPYLRSPNYSKSPIVEPLTEELDNLSLDYDEVFHLEGDFEDTTPTTATTTHNNSLHQSTPQSDGDPLHKRFSRSDNSPLTSNGGTALRRNSNNTSATGTAAATRKAVFGGELNASATTNGNGYVQAPLSSSANSSSGKYVPPFRRSSLSSSNGTTPAGVNAFRRSFHEKRDLHHPHHHSPQQHIHNGHTHHQQACQPQHHSLDFTSGNLHGTGIGGGSLHSNGSRPVSSPLAELSKSAAATATAGSGGNTSTGKAPFEQHAHRSGVPIEWVSSFRKDWCDYD
ncbi:Serine/threonine-protein kinase KSP1 [Candida viswanathii]|uniref:non-specific serine/threonine protein kinase n=1 Tax=Candida viswanathii TaxID=5486 RepID=A0A367XRL3_9ASCO|nr:Serine/threonine-protein kinase KSP1 [Candida viswanathii]